jgi:hypothetical protein
MLLMPIIDSWSLNLPVRFLKTRSAVTQHTPNICAIDSTVPTADRYFTYRPVTRLEANTVGIVMKMGSAKRLDEACNHYNEVYNDEVLYTVWTEAPHAEDVRRLSAATSATYNADVDAFMARLYANNQH